MSPFSAFELAASAIGSDFNAHTFWDQYIQFEEDRKRPDNILKILARVITLPLAHFVRFFEKYFSRLYLLHTRFGIVSVTRPTSELITPQQEEEFLAEIASQGPKEKSKDEIETELRYKIHHLKSETYLATQHHVHSRWKFEVEIKRPWFHYKPLEESEIANWRAYLDFEESQGDHECIIKLYERCLVPCVCYLFDLIDRRCMKSSGSGIYIPSNDHTGMLSILSVKENP
jgi:pre-mRNA-processing factor 39